MLTSNTLVFKAIFLPLLPCYRPGTISNRTPRIHSFVNKAIFQWVSEMHVSRDFEMTPLLVSTTSSRSILSCASSIQSVLYRSVETSVTVRRSYTTIDVLKGCLSTWSSERFPQPASSWELDHPATVMPLIGHHAGASFSSVPRP